ncbi:uncharacterized protein LOC135484891 [Lineus longissimus]|uniref:uncharacterized protein LOC135484891 n=1 Tax=Lineus longissimus TaxID=88925 RepID=UPI00315D6D07
MERLTELQIAELKDTFMLFNKDGDGHITPEELQESFKEMGLEFTQTELQEMIKEIDDDDNGLIDFPEFLHFMAQKMKEAQQTDEIMQEAFKMFDSGTKGYIGAEDVKQMLGIWGEEISMQDVRALMKEADNDGDGKIDFEGRHSHQGVTAVTEWFLTRITNVLSKTFCSWRARHRMVFSRKAEHLTEDQIAELKEAFNLFNKNGDGHICETELVLSASQMGLKIPDYEARLMINEIDEDDVKTKEKANDNAKVDDDGDHVVDFPEFLNFMAIQMKEARQKDDVMQHAYKLFDRGNKGYISPEDVRTMMGILEEDITAEEVNQIIREVDPTGSGRINFEDFHGMIMSR